MLALWNQLADLEVQSIKVDVVAYLLELCDVGAIWIR